MTWLDALPYAIIAIVVTGAVVLGVRHHGTTAARRARRHGQGFGVLDEVFRPTQHEARAEQLRGAEIGDVVLDAQPVDALDEGTITIVAPPESARG